MRELDVEQTVLILNRILEYELAGVVRYTHYAFMVTGPYRQPIVTFLRAQAQESLAHADQAGELITGLEAHPSLDVAQIEESHKHDLRARIRNSRGVCRWVWSSDVLLHNGCCGVFGGGFCPPAGDPVWRYVFATRSSSDPFLCSKY